MGIPASSLLDHQPPHDHIRSAALWHRLATASHTPPFGYSNAINHGLLSTEVVLRWEGQALFDSFFQSVLDRFQPADDAEYLLVEEIVAAKWRLRRAWSIENRLISDEVDCMEAPELRSQSMK